MIEGCITPCKNGKLVSFRLLLHRIVVDIEMKSSLFCILGPTAVGKTEIAIQLAQSTSDLDGGLFHDNNHRHGYEDQSGYAGIIERAAIVFNP